MRDKSSVGVSSDYNVDSSKLYWRVRYLEDRVLDQQAELYAKETTIQKLVQGETHSELQQRIAEFEQQVLTQQRELREKEAVIQQLSVRARSSPRGSIFRRFVSRLSRRVHCCFGTSKCQVRRSKSPRPDNIPAKTYSSGQDAPPSNNASEPIRAAPRIILGAGDSRFPGWHATDRDDLDIALRSHFALYWQSASRQAFLAEHVWEHLHESDGDAALKNCYEFLKPGGRIRIAVPDAFHPDPGYQQWVRPGGIGPCADDHKVFYDYRALSDKLDRAGFRVELLEYWDESGRFHFLPWSWSDGPIRRSSQHDSRNLAWPNSYTSLIVDGIKPCSS